MLEMIPTFAVHADVHVRDFEGELGSGGPAFQPHEHTLSWRVSEPQLDAFLKVLRDNGVTRFAVEREEIR
jgi:hypothetical protein